MSYVVEILRPIAAAEFVALVDADASLALLDRGDDWAEASWKDGDKAAIFTLAQGRVTITTPSHEAWDKAQEIARRLDARVIGEEDEFAPSRPVDPDLVADRSYNLGWPIVVIVLGGLLIWKW